MYLFSWNKQGLSAVNNQLYSQSKHSKINLVIRTQLFFSIYLSIEFVKMQNNYIHFFFFVNRFYGISIYKITVF